MTRALPPPGFTLVSIQYASVGLKSLNSLIRAPELLPSIPNCIPAKSTPGVISIVARPSVGLIQRAGPVNPMLVVPEVSAGAPPPDPNPPPSKTFRTQQITSRMLTRPSPLQSALTFTLSGQASLPGLARVQFTR